MGSSPRVRSRRILFGRRADVVRDHLRVCGADSRFSKPHCNLLGSSPRVRSRPIPRERAGGQRGIISACAEQTDGHVTRIILGRDHLRVCGADLHVHIDNRLPVGSSPRVRSRLSGQNCWRLDCGIISACAEQTRRNTALPSRAWDHLRVCGADRRRIIRSGSTLGSSPRVRSRPRLAWHYWRRSGIISACAEQTVPMDHGQKVTGDHLRVCGADYPVVGDTSIEAGSSPRVRSRPLALLIGRRPRGIISACAEQTNRPARQPRHRRDHLRVCGADPTTSGALGGDMGSSPRVRSRRVDTAGDRTGGGIISACAEQTRYVRP